MNILSSVRTLANQVKLRNGLRNKQIPFLEANQRISEPLVWVGQTYKIMQQQLGFSPSVYWSGGEAAAKMLRHVSLIKG